MASKQFFSNALKQVVPGEFPAARLRQRSVILIALFYLFAERHIVTGLTAGAVKG